MRVCDNPACEYNSMEMPGNPHGRVVEVLLRDKPWHTMSSQDKMQVKQITRHMYYNPQRHEKFYLCGCCHSARQMCV